MYTNNSSTFSPPSASTRPTRYAGGTPEQYPIGPSHTHAYPPPRPSPETRSARNDSGFMSPPNAPRPHPSPSLSAHGHPPYHQPTHDPVGNPTIQMPEVQATPVPSYTSSAPLLMGETSGETMYMPDPLNNIQPAPVPYLSYPLQTPVVSHPPSQHGGPGGMLGNEHTSAHVQGYQNELNDGRYPSGQVPSSTPHTYMQSRSPPGCGAAGLRPEQRRDSAHNSQPTSQPESKCCGLCGGN